MVRLDGRVAGWVAAAMTQDQIDSLLNHRAQLDLLQKNYQRRKTVLYNRRKALLETCDHKLPDGTTAVEGGFLLGRCTICGAR